MAPERRSPRKKQKPQKPRLPRQPRVDTHQGKLTEMQAKFVDHYAHTGNGRQSAIAAGYSRGRADVEEAELKRNPKIQAAIAAAIAGVEEGYRPTAARIMREHAMRAFSDPSEIVRIEAGGLQITNTADLTPAARRMILEATQTTTQFGGTLHVKLVDPLPHLMQLAKLMKLTDTPFALDPSSPVLAAAKLYFPVQLEA